MSIENAADAFAADMNGGKAVAREGNGAEEIFSNSATHETDLVAGGDDEADPKVFVKKGKQPKSEETDDMEEFNGLDEEEEEELDEDGEEEDESDADDDEDGDDGDEDGIPKDIAEKRIRVLVDGEEEEISVKDAIDGIIRVKTFHKRLNQVDGYKQELLGHATKVAEDRKRVDDMLAEAEEMVKGILPAEPDWDKLFAEDPKAARDLQKQYDGYKKLVDDIKAKRETATKADRDRQAAELAEYGKTEFPKFAAHAKWRNQDDMKKDIDSMRRTAKAVGFSDDEVGQVLDSRMLTILLKASKYDRMMASRPRAVKNGKTPVNPGAGSNRTARRGVNGAQKKLAKTGSIEDAANVFGQIIRR